MRPGFDSNALSPFGVNAGRVAISLGKSPLSVYCVATCATRSRARASADTAASIAASSVDQLEIDTRSAGRPRQRVAPIQQTPSLWTSAARAA